MPLHGFPEDSQCGFSIPALGHKGLQDFASVVERSPDVARDAVDLHKDRIQMPSPVWQGPHTIDPLASGLGGNIWPQQFHQNRTVS